MKAVFNKYWEKAKRFFQFQWDLYKYDVAVFIADTKYILSGKKLQYFVLPNQNDILVVLNYPEIERLKITGEIKYKVKLRKKKIVRKKTIKGRVVNKSKSKQIVISKKAYAVSMMDYNVTISDVARECFYYTPNGINKLTEDVLIAKRNEWIRYADEVRRNKNEK